ncbi:MAG TPA: magnesium chelatase, partial [Deinococcales bacterium]|nr:magnesium chelatase [Deinococcales bacterium]
KDRIGSEIRTHYPRSLAEGMAITAQEARTDLPGRRLAVPAFVHEVVERVAFEAREDRRLDPQSGVSQRLPASLLELAFAAAEQRGLLSGEDLPAVRTADIRAGLPAVTGRIEPDYEGELLGAEKLAAELVRAAVAATFRGLLPDSAGTETVAWFEAGNVFRIPAGTDAADLPELLGRVPGLLGAARRAAGTAAATPELLGSTAEFILEGLHATGRIGRSEELGFTPKETDLPAEPAGRRWN